MLLLILLSQLDSSTHWPMYYNRIFHASVQMIFRENSINIYRSLGLLIGRQTDDFFFSYFS